jgi:hypothetical protein
VEDEDEQNECLRPLEMDKMSFSTREFVWPRERESCWRSGDIYKSLSQETSCWADL